MDNLINLNFNEESLWYFDLLKDDIINENLNSINTFQNPDYVKYQDFTVLKFIINFTKNLNIDILDNIIYTLIKNLFKFDEKDFIIIILEISSILSKNNDSEILISLISKYIKKECNKSSFKTLGNTLKIGSKILEFCNFDKVIKECLSIFIDLESIMHDEKDLYIDSSLFLNSLIKISNENIKQYLPEIFSFILNLQSILTSFDNSDNLNDSLELLSTNCGYKSKSELYTLNINKILDEFYINKSYKEWDKNNLERFKFEVIVKNSKEGIINFFEIILEIIAENVKPDKDFELKFDMISWYQYIISFDDLTPNFKSKKYYILENIFINILVWRMGKPNMKVRKAGIILFIESIDKKIFDDECLKNLFEKYLPVLKTCLNDDYAPDLRFGTIQLCTKILSNSELTNINLCDFYPILLERLDDAQDEVRIEASKSLMSFIESKNSDISYSTLEYLIKCFFVHLDDKNEDLQWSMYNLILKCVKINSDLVLDHAKYILPQMRFQRLCEDIIKQIENN